jgi:hypothetical protein
VGRNRETRFGVCPPALASRADSTDDLGGEGREAIVIPNDSDPTRRWWRAARKKSPLDRILEALIALLIRAVGSLHERVPRAGLRRKH